jgi:hypothetical protein
VPENIPHLSSPISGPAGGIGAGLLGQPRSGSVQAGSPVKESSFLHRETSADDVNEDLKNKDVAAAGGAATAQTQMAGQSDGIPIRR